MDGYSLSYMAVSKQDPTTAQRNSEFREIHCPELFREQSAFPAPAANWELPCCWCGCSPCKLPPGIQYTQLPQEQDLLQLGKSSQWWNYPSHFQDAWKVWKFAKFAVENKCFHTETEPHIQHLAGDSGGVIRQLQESSSPRAGICIHISVFCWIMARAAGC